MSDDCDKPPPKWHHPSEVMKLHNLKLKKRALQARIKGAKSVETSTKSEKFKDSTNIQPTQKRKNPFIIDNIANKRNRIEETLLEDESTDQTLFKILNQTNERLTTTNQTFENVLDKINETDGVVVVKNKGETCLPIDWTLKRKLRLWSPRPFPWNHKLKINEEASGITAFARCLDIDDDDGNRTKLDTSPNSRFHQCCLYWQYPSLPWLTLFPRNNNDNKTNKTNDNNNMTNSAFVMNSTIRTNLHNTWTDSLRSLFQLIRTKQCPYFYCCTNNFTILFRAAGICGFSDVHVLICPTTRGFRQALKQNDIEFMMPLKKHNNKRDSDQGYDTQDSTITDQNDDSIDAELANLDDDDDDDEWLKSMGINAEDIKQINFTQAKIAHRTECEIDHSEQSLVLIEGVEVHAFYNYLINCKSTTSTTGQLAGIPPTLLSPVAFNGATLNTLKMRENKVHIDNSDYYSIELLGPILPTTVHNLFAIKPIENSMSATFGNLPSTSPFSKVTKHHSSCSNNNTNNTIFDKENLCDCGLNRRILEQFCQPNRSLTSIECLKYNCDNKTYQWT